MNTNCATCSILDPAEKQVVNMIRRIRQDKRKYHTFVTLEINTRDIRITEHVQRGIATYGTKAIDNLPPVE